MGSSHRQTKSLSKKRKSHKDLTRLRKNKRLAKDDEALRPRKKKHLAKDNETIRPRKKKSSERDSEALRHQLLEKMLPDIIYTPDSRDQQRRPPYYIVMRNYAGVQMLDIRSDDAGVLQCISDYAEGHVLWIEASTVKDPDLSDCHRIEVIDDPLQHRPFPAMLPTLLMKFIERVLGYERVITEKDSWMFERTSPFKRSKGK